MSGKQRRKYHNIMEDLVAEEVRSQMALLSPRLTQYIQRIEVETFALNRLPTLYASSREGWLHQQKRARDEYQVKIKTAVRQALAAVQRDPLRSSTPLFSEKEEVLAETATRSNTSEMETTQELPPHPFYWQQKRSPRYSQQAK
ncbi:MAG: late competence development ComFB family protein [Lyngbya sp.]|nr:late competence development ComFB family protein [Lyngbya sp.]